MTRNCCSIIVCFTSLIVLSWNSLAADTIRLKSGKTYTNVKSSLTRKSIIVKLQDGRRIVINRKQLRSLQKRPVQWNQPEIEKSVEVNVEPQPISEPEEKSDQVEPSYSYDSSNAYFALIPGWSPLYLSDDWWGIAPLFSLLELAAVYGTSLYLPSPRKALEDAGTRDLILLFSTYPTVGTNAALFMYVDNSDRVIDPYKNSVVSRSTFSSARNAAVGGLVSMLIFDSLLSYFLMPDQSSRKQTTTSSGYSRVRQASWNTRADLSGNNPGVSITYSIYF